MAKPVILTVDDDPDVLQAIERDLRSRYSERYRIMRASSASEALDTLRRLKSRNDAVALLLADQRMPELDGVGFLAQATELYPSAKRALLTAYADTNAAIEAINSARVHYFLLKPWDPPDQNLYPALDDMLTEFMDSYHPPYEGIQLFGTRWSPKAYELRMFLAQNHLPYQWVDVEQSSTTDSAAVLKKSDGTPETLPLMVFPDGIKLSEPTSADIAKKIGRARSSVTETLSLRVIPDSIRKTCIEDGIVSKSLLLQVARQPNEKKMREMVGRIAQGGLTRDEARRARKEESGPEARPHPFLFDYEPPDGAFHLRIQFRKSHVSREELAAALRSILREIESGNISSSAA